MKLNRVTVTSPQKKVYDLDASHATDFFWAKNVVNPFPQVAEDIDTELNQYKHGHQVSSSHMQNNKLGKSSVLEDWVIRGMTWPSRLFERGLWDGGEGQLMEMEMLDARDAPLEALDEDGMWEDNVDATAIMLNIVEPTFQTILQRYICTLIGRDRCVRKLHSAVEI